ncbi:hypothetical protein [Chryseobacterium sp.]|uniref:hypothetical protein n=1 Tax=Chryseobacterium sp. TaxID=1871047 RepID=UPI0025C5DC44|nr:hypothetical protein [Chryseobacterium sp.]
MKKQFLLIITLFSCIEISAQIYTPSGAVTGATTNPTTGNIGIGISTPKRKLHIAGGDIWAEGYAMVNFGDDARFSVTNTEVPNLSSSTFSMGQYGIAAVPSPYSAELWISGNDGIRMFTRGYGKPRMTILNNGYVGINSTTPDSELTVNGKIHAKEVKVDLSVPADYVFEKYYTGKSSLNPQYKMLSLEEVETFTKDNNHLPGIPSAKTIQKEGLNVGEVTNLLLQKIEELTLYTIELKKEISEQNKEIEKLKSLKD